MQNPANLAFMPGAEFRWSGDVPRRRRRRPWQGHAFAFGCRSPFLISASACASISIDPPSADADRALRGDSNYQWLTWGSRWAPKRGALGVVVAARLLGGTADRRFELVVARASRRARSNQLGHGVRRRTTSTPRRSRAGGPSRVRTTSRSRSGRSHAALELGLEGKYVDAGDGVLDRRARRSASTSRRSGGCAVNSSVSDPDDSAGAAGSPPRDGLLFQRATGGDEVAGGSMFGDAARPRRCGQNAHEEPRSPTSRSTASASPPLRRSPLMPLRIRIENTPGIASTWACSARLWDDRRARAERRARRARAAHGPRRNRWRTCRSCATPSTCASRQEGALPPRGRRRRVALPVLGGRPHSDQPGRRHPLRRASHALLLLRGPARQARHQGRLRAHRRAQERARDVHARRRDRRRARRQDRPPAAARAAVRRTVSPHGRKHPAEALRAAHRQGPVHRVEAKAAGLVDGYAFDDELEVEAGKAARPASASARRQRAPRARDRLRRGAPGRRSSTSTATWSTAAARPSRCSA